MSSSSLTSATSQPPPKAKNEDTKAQADKKREHRAQKKAEQDKRKEERRRIALETGVDPALLPEAIGGGVSNGKIEPKGFLARKWAKVPFEGNTKDSKPEGKDVSIMTWNVSPSILSRYPVSYERDYKLHGRCDEAFLSRRNRRSFFRFPSSQMLAQALVRRELFPGSDCLKGKDRLPPLMAE